MQIEWRVGKKVKASFKLLVAGRNPMLRLPSASKVLFVGVPIHDNLGDHLLADAGESLLGTLFGDRRVIEVSTEEYMLNKSRVAAALSPSDYVFVAGGGWMGDAWPNDEMSVRDIVELASPICPVVILPQTVHYQSRGEFFESGRKFWGSASGFHICTRERSSYRLLTEDMGVPREHCSLLPDIGLLYEFRKKASLSRDGALVCLRGDRESLTSEQERSWLNIAVRKRFREVKNVSTLSKRVISPRKRKQFIEMKITEFATVELVLTDRLHGMIFSVLAGTPCIAINNRTGKVHGVYDEWLSEYPGVKIVEAPSDVEPLLESFESVFPESRLLESKRATLRADLLNYCVSELKELVNE